MPERSAAVVGAGIAGLAAAYRLEQAGWRVDVLEAEARAGGRVETVAKGGYLIDTGATAIAARYPIFTAFATELGMRILPAKPYLGVARGGQVHLLRLDRLVRSGVTTKLLSPRTKLRLGRLVADVVANKVRGRLQYDDLRKAAVLDNETASAYVRRIAGREADEFLAEPMTRALLLTDSDAVSRVELMSGLINAVAGKLTTLAGGQGAIVTELVRRLRNVETSTPVEHVAIEGDGVDVRTVGADGPRTRRYDGCVLATQLPVAAALVEADPIRRLDKELRFTRGINVAVGTTRAPNTPAFLVLLPRSEEREICMLIVESNKAPDRAPAGHGLLTVSFERSAAEEWIDRSDADIVARALETVYRLFPELVGTVDMTYVRRWPIALPQTKPGVYRAIGDFAAGLDAGSRIQYAGDYLSQTGQNTAVAWGERAAANLIAAHP